MTVAQGSSGDCAVRAQWRVGTITSLWNAVVDDSGPTWRFSGVMHNGTVQPMEGTSFGFCVTTP